MIIAFVFYRKKKKFCNMIADNYGNFSETWVKFWYEWIYLKYFCFLTF